MGYRWSVGLWCLTMRLYGCAASSMGLTRVDARDVGVGEDARGVAPRVVLLAPGEHGFDVAREGATGGGARARAGAGRRGGAGVQGVGGEMGRHGVEVEGSSAAAMDDE
mmetsp:Transcript_6303/g.20648  ORF Transcript_6303/g.20648 Transcript_6303/m.20648 type:complete len:109 (-) Transcript_6303:1291-1617(-)